MRVVFHIISTGGGAGGSRVTRYIAERDNDPEREGTRSRPLFSDEREGMSYRTANRVLDPGGEPQKDDLLHFSVSFQEEDFEKLGSDEKERQERLREVIREGMKGMAEEFNVERLTWVAGIHRNSEHPHVHIVARKDAIERGTGVEKRIGRIRKSLLPHKEMEAGKEVIVPGRIGQRFLSALEKQQELYLTPEHPRTKARIAFEQMIERIEEGGRNQGERGASDRGSGHAAEVRSERGSEPMGQQLDHRSIGRSWSDEAPARRPENGDFGIALGRQYELDLRLRFAQAWYERAVEHGDTYRFNVLDESTTDERKISELDVHRRAAARAQRLGGLNRATREQAYEADLFRHRETLDQLSEAREGKIAALGKDVSALRGKLGKVETSLAFAYEIPASDQTPLLSRATLSELQAQAVKLNLPDTVSELESVRVKLAHEYDAPTRDDKEAATLAAQLNVARADLLARETRLERFEASVHLANYEVGDERWSLAALDKQVARRREDARLIPDRATRLDFRSLAHINYSATGREEAAAEVEHLVYVRSEIVREIERRREPLVADRDLARDMVEVLDNAYSAEQRSHERRGELMPEPVYQANQMHSLETSAETSRDANLLREVHEWEKASPDRETNWEGRAVAREIMASLAVEETRERLQHFLDSQRVASLHLGNHRTGSLREVEARTLTDYLARAIESQAQRDHRHTIKLAAREHHGRLVSDFEKAGEYHDAAREQASAANGHEAKFTDKEKINLEIYAERQTDPQNRERLMELARGSESRAQERDVASVSRGR